MISIWHLCLTSGLTSRGDISGMTSKMKTILTAFSGLIVYSALCTVFGYIFSERVYIKLVACGLTIILGGSYIKTVLKYPKVWNSPSKKLIIVSLAVIVVFAFTSMLTSTYLLSAVIHDEAFLASVEAKRELPLALQLLTLFVSFIMAPFAEEIIFRGLMYRQLSEFNKTFALIFTSVFFAIWHGTLIHLYTGLIGGLILGCIYEKTHKLRYSVIAHALFNILTSIAGVFSYAEWFTSIWFVILMNAALIVLMVLLFRTEGIKPVQAVKSTSKVTS